MEENEYQWGESSIEIVEGNNSKEPQLNCCIHKVPHFVRRLNEEAYIPRVVSIGPLHYGKEEFMGMERVKNTYYSSFKKRVNPQILKDFETYIKNQLQFIRAHYSVTSGLQDCEYVAMIQRDAVFIMEYFWNYYFGANIFPKTPLLSYVVVDLLLLENQLPYFVLDQIYTKVFPEGWSFHEFFLEMLEGYAIFSPSPKFLASQPQPKHFTDLSRWALLNDIQPALQSGNQIEGDLPCATKLRKSGLKFKGIQKKCLLDIKFGKRKQYGKWLQMFEANELQIPIIKIYDETEYILRNLMAWELFAYPTESHICSYVVLMDYLIDTEKDVDFLVEEGIIVNCVGNNEAIAKMFNRLCLQIPMPSSCYYETVEKMRAHYRKRWNHAMATLKSVYFSNLWTGTATIAATFLLIVTVMQTICSVIQVHQGYTR